MVYNIIIRTWNGIFTIFINYSEFPIFWHCSSCMITYEFILMIIVLDISSQYFFGLSLPLAVHSGTIVKTDSVARLYSQSWYKKYLRSQSFQGWGVYGASDVDVNRGVVLGGRSHTRYADYQLLLHGSFLGLRAPWLDGQHLRTKLTIEHTVHSIFDTMLVKI